MQNAFILPSMHWSSFSSLLHSVCVCVCCSFSFSINDVYVFIYLNKNSLRVKQFKSTIKQLEKKQQIYEHREQAKWKRNEKKMSFANTQSVGLFVARSRAERTLPLFEYWMNISFIWWCFTCSLLYASGTNLMLKSNKQ